MQRAHTVPLAVLMLVLSVATVASAQFVPTPDTNDLGFSENDVREEPSAPEDANGFQPAPSGEAFWSPKEDPLVFDGFIEYGEATGEDLVLSEDLSNVKNRAQHGNNYEAYERTMYPGPNSFGAWWGHWSDTGGGGDLQQSAVTDGTALTTEAGNGVIDDANDCQDRAWDEFTWRGAWRGDGNPQCGVVVDGGDTLLAFVQPGTHNIHVNSLPIPTLGPTIPPSPIHNDTDSSQVADFSYTCNMDENGQACTGPNGFARYEYDNSLLMTTQVLSVVNPDQTDQTIRGHTAYDPFTPSPEADTYKLDQDIYTAVDGLAEDAYRTTIWDPPEDYGDGEDEENAFSTLHPGGPKEFVKEDGSHLMVTAPERAREAAAQAIEPVGVPAGLVYDSLFGPRPHEPNTGADQYGIAADGSEVDWASFDAGTSYDPTTDADGDGEAEYYEPGADQTYTAYQEGEHTWMDTITGMDVCPIWAQLNCYHEWVHLGPSLPSAGSPVADAASKGDHRSAAPGILYVHGYLGTWHDGNDDTWVGDAGDGAVRAPGKHGPALVAAEEGQPYSNGLIQDPNQYDTQRFSHDEWRPVCSGSWDVTLTSNHDPDNDGRGEWGTTGVYVFPTSDDGVPYSDMYMDLAGDAAQPVGDAVRDNENTPGEETRWVLPDDENGRLSRYRVEGPINLTMDNPSGSCDRWGSWDPFERVLFPAGNPGYSFTVTAVAENTAANRVSQHGANKGNPLAGETIRDVDVIHANQDAVESQTVVADHPLGNN